MNLLNFEYDNMLWALFLVAGLGVLMVHLGRKNPDSFSRRRTIKVVLGFTLCVLGLARPQLGHQTTESRSTRFNLFIAVDISRSMLAEDITPNRLQFSIAFAQRLLGLINGARVAIFPFANDGFIQMPLTNDLTAASELLQALDTSMTTSQGTDFTSSLQSLFERIARMEETSERAAAGWAPPQVLLFSDGETHKATSGGVLKLFRDAHIPIHTVGVGTREGATLLLPNFIGSLSSTQETRGQAVRTKLDEKSLRELSDVTGGSYFTASVGETGRVAQRLTQSMQFGKLAVRFKADQELFPFFFLIALLLFTWEFCLCRWQYAIRAWLPLALILAAHGAPALGETEPDFDLPPADAEPQPEPEPSRPEKKMDDGTKAILVFNEALTELKSGKLDKAAEHFQEASFLTPDKTVKKKALFNLGNSYLRNMDPQQALQVYQEAYDTRTDDDDFDKQTNKKISENIALASRVQQQMKGQQSSDDRDGKNPNDQEKQGQDRGGPQRDYESQPLTENEKKRIFDSVASEEQQIMKRQMEKKSRNKPKDPNAKPW